MVILRADIVSGGTGEVQETVGEAAATELDVAAAITWLKSPGNDLCDVNYNDKSMCTDTGIQAIVLLNSRGGSSDSAAS